MLELVCAIRVDLCSFGDVVGVDRNICVDAGCILARRDDFDVCVCACLQELVGKLCHDDGGGKRETIRACFALK